MLMAQLDKQQPCDCDNKRHLISLQDEIVKAASHQLAAKFIEFPTLQTWWFLFKSAISIYQIQEKQLSTWKTTVKSKRIVHFLSGSGGVTNVNKFSLVPRLRKIFEPGKSLSAADFQGRVVMLSHHRYYIPSNVPT